jgi:hypothetical protein
MTFKLNTIIMKLFLMICSHHNLHSFILFSFSHSLVEHPGKRDTSEEEVITRCATDAN